MSVLEPNYGRQASAGGNDVTFRLGPDEGANALSMFESRVPPGGGTLLPHLHEEYEEVFYVLSGQVDFLLGDRWQIGAAGSIVHIPRQTPHAFVNRSGERAHLIVIHTPATAVRMIEELADRPQDAVAIFARHRTRVVGPPISPAARETT